MEALLEAIKIAGSQTELARRINVTQSHIWNWLNRDKRVPAEYVLPIESAVGGKVDRTKLRPDLFLPTATDRTTK